MDDYSRSLGESVSTTEQATESGAGSELVLARRTVMRTLPDAVGAKEDSRRRESKEHAWRATRQ
jgi:hypothetical protein